MNWAQKRPKSAIASRIESDRPARIATANTDCAAVSSSSPRCSLSIGSPLVRSNEPDAKANTMGRLPTSSVHWLTFDETRVLSPSADLSRHA